MLDGSPSLFCLIAQTKHRLLYSSSLLALQHWGFVCRLCDYMNKYEARAGYQFVSVNWIHRLRQASWQTFTPTPKLAFRSYNVSQSSQSARHHDTITALGSLEDWWPQAAVEMRKHPFSIEQVSVHQNSGQLISSKKKKENSIIDKCQDERILFKAVIQRDIEKKYRPTDSTLTTRRVYPKLNNKKTYQT